VKVAIDILTPKQCMLFSRLSARLEEEGVEVLRTTRRYREVNQLLRLKGLDAIVVGRHGGGTLEGKLRASTRRILRLTSIIMEWRPDVMVSFSSPEAARVAFGLKIPHVCVNDSPHAEAVARLTIPLSTRLLTPKVIPKGEWTRFGIRDDQIIQYNALDPWAWLKDLQPNPHVLDELGLQPSKPIVVLRVEEALSAYLMGRLRGEASIISIARKLLERFQNLQLVVLPRYRGQVGALRKAIGGGVTVCGRVVDGPSLLSFTSIFIGAGGTMTAEAALLGVPTISCYPAEPFIVEKYLLEKGLLIRETSPEGVVEAVSEILEDLEGVRARQRRRAQALTGRFEDPIETIANTIFEVYEKRE